jgi:hypothetical protein
MLFATIFAQLECLKSKKLKAVYLQKTSCFATGKVVAQFKMRPYATAFKNGK